MNEGWGIGLGSSGVKAVTFTGGKSAAGKPAGLPNVFTAAGTLSRRRCAPGTKAHSSPENHQAVLSTAPPWLFQPILAFVMNLFGEPRCGR